MAAAAAAAHCQETQLLESQTLGPPFGDYDDTQVLEDDHAVKTPVLDETYCSNGGEYPTALWGETQLVEECDLPVDGDALGVADFVTKNRMVDECGYQETQLVDECEAAAEEVDVSKSRDVRVDGVDWAETQPVVDSVDDGCNEGFTAHGDDGRETQLVEDFEGEHGGEDGDHVAGGNEGFLVGGDAENQDEVDTQLVEDREDEAEGDDTERCVEGTEQLEQPEKGGCFVDSDVSTDEDDDGSGPPLRQLASYHRASVMISGAEIPPPPMVAEENTDGGVVRHGLSYIGSQEPSILSQAAALEVVDQLILASDLDCSLKAQSAMNVEAATPPTLPMRGVQMLARKVNSGSPVGNRRIFDWDENTEDGGGGGFFSRKKDVLLGRPATCAAATTGAAKSKCRVSETINAMGARKNLFKGTNRVLLSSGSGLSGQREETAALVAVPTGTVGPDTQMAVEAMEALAEGFPSCPASIIEGDTGEDRQTGCFQSSPKLAEVPRKKRTESWTEPMPQKRTNPCADVSPGSASMRRKLRSSSATKRGPEELDMPQPPKRRRVFIRSAVDLLQIAKKVRWQRGSAGMTSLLSGVITRSRLTARLPPAGVTAAIPSGVTTRSQSTARSPPASVTAAKVDRVLQSTDIQVVAPPKGDNQVSPAFTPELRSKTAAKAMRKLETAAKARRKMEAFPPTASRRRKDMTTTHVLFSRHLDEDTVKHQRKILQRMGAAEAISAVEATHFVADRFIRTQNMLEAIALGKPIVTSQWLESCRCAGCFVDEQSYVLRDAAKEKEIGFSMPCSLTAAAERPLLQGTRVFITQSVKPSRDILASLVQASSGQLLESTRSISRQGRIADNVLVISCEEDYDAYVPLLERGARVFSSELLLNGIVIQKLEFDRHRLFPDHPEPVLRRSMRSRKGAGSS